MQNPRKTRAFRPLRVSAHSYRLRVKSSFSRVFSAHLCPAGDLMNAGFGAPSGPFNDHRDCVGGISLNRFSHCRAVHSCGRCYGNGFPTVSRLPARFFRQADEIVFNVNNLVLTLPDIVSAPRKVPLTETLKPSELHRCRHADVASRLAKLVRKLGWDAGAVRVDAVPLFTQFNTESLVERP